MIKQLREGNEEGAIAWFHANFITAPGPPQTAFPAAHTPLQLWISHIHPSLFTLSARASSPGPPRGAGSGAWRGPGTTPHGWISERARVHYNTHWRL